MLNKALLPIIVVLAILQATIFAQEDTTSAETPALSAQKPADFYFDFLSYRYDLHRRVVSRWEGLVRANRDKLKPGNVVVRYYINTNGAISSIESHQPGSFSSEMSNERKLAEYALALENKEPSAFPETVSREYPRGFFYQITLSFR